MSGPAKMVADSTQSDESLIRKAKKKNVNSKKIKNGKKLEKKKTKKKEIKDKEEEIDPNLDLTKTVLPIGDYCHDRAAMLEQMFEAVQGSSFNMILPEILVDMDLKELKVLCLEHLEVMSKKRIFRILAGDDPDTISSSGTEDEEDVNTECKHAPDSTSNTPLEVTSEISELSQENTNNKQTENQESKNETLTAVKEEKLCDSGCISPVPSSPNAFEIVNIEETVNDKIDEPVVIGDECMIDEEEDGEINESESGSLIPMLTQNHMELLELEMRARAIKAMLNAQEKNAEPS